MKKNIIVILLICLFTIGITGCGSTSDNGSTNNNKQNNEAPMFRETSTYVGSDLGDVLYYDTPFYDVIKCNDLY